MATSRSLDEQRMEFARRRVVSAIAVCGSHRLVRCWTWRGHACRQVRKYGYSSS